MLVHHLWGPWEWGHLEVPKRRCRDLEAANHVYMEYAKEQIYP